MTPGRLNELKQFYTHDSAIGECVEEIERLNIENTRMRQALQLAHDKARLAIVYTNLGPPSPNNIRQRLSEICNDTLAALGTVVSKD